MNYNYLIKIDKDLVTEQQDIARYIYDMIKQDKMLDKIDDIKCIKSSDLIDDCRKKINKLGNTTKQKDITTERCEICDNKYEINQFIFKFNICNHTYHKKCIKRIFKQDKKTLCICCNDKYIENIINII